MYNFIRFWMQLKIWKNVKTDFLSFKYWTLKKHSNWKTNIKRCYNIQSRKKWYNLISSLNIDFLKTQDNNLSQKSIENIQNLRKLILIHTPLHTPKLNIHPRHSLKVQFTIYLLKSNPKFVCSPIAYAIFSYKAVSH